MGNLSPVRFADTREILTTLTTALGRLTTIGALEAKVKPIEDHLSDLQRRYGYYRFNMHIEIYRQLFRWAASPTYGILPRPFKWIDLLKKQPIRQWRADRIQSEREGVRPILESADLRSVIDLATEPLGTMILLAYFGAYGNDDLAQLPADLLKVSDGTDGLPHGWGVLHYPRPKTLIDRLCVIPPTVVERVHKARDDAPKTKTPAYRALLFRTRRGLPMIGAKIHRDENDTIKKVVRRDNVRQLWKYLLARVGRCVDHGIVHKTDGACSVCRKPTTAVKSKGFYSIRRTSITRASGASDMDTLRLFEGHALDPVRAAYLIEVERHKFVAIAEQLAKKIGWPITRIPSPTEAGGASVAPAGAAESPTVQPRKIA